MGKLINIDNGGTLTDIVVVDGDQIYRTKTLTTPFDLSQCFFDGLRKVSHEVYGQEDLEKLFSSTDYIRYSTTQGTNALIQRKGPQIGLIASTDGDVDGLLRGEVGSDLLDALVGPRVARIDPTLSGAAFSEAVVNVVHDLTAAGANRLVVSMSGPKHATHERAVKKELLTKFPSHLLGTVPVVYSAEVAYDDDDLRRARTAILNAFLHPAMEEFLYHSQNRLRQSGIPTPLLIFRNDGGTARVAKTRAISTLSSGPRGGLGGSVALAEHYGIENLVTVDVGGTSSDIGGVRRGDVSIEIHGRVEDIPISNPLADIASLGVGGGSIIRVADGVITVGPESVGAAPGPACFALGGTDATITDAILAKGVIDPSTYLGGEMHLDRDRARAAINENIASPIGVSVDEAIELIIKAWTSAIAEGIRASDYFTSDTVLAAFGGAGPMLACRIADDLGLDRVLIPGTAAVFSAVGIGFSDLFQQYRAPVETADPTALSAMRSSLLEEAKRDMFAEGVDLSECVVESSLLAAVADKEPVRMDLQENGTTASEVPADAPLFVVVKAAKLIPKVQLASDDVATTASPVIGGERDVVSERTVSIPVYHLRQQLPGVQASGPFVLEEDYFTALVPHGWHMRVTTNRDIWLHRS